MLDAFQFGLLSAWGEGWGAPFPLGFGHVGVLIFSLVVGSNFSFCIRWRPHMWRCGNALEKWLQLGLVDRPKDHAMGSLGSPLP